MKKILIALAIILFTINAGAQQTKPATKKTESCCAKNSDHAKMTPEEQKKCETKCKSEGKKCTAKDMDKSKSTEKSCCAKK